MPKEFDRDPTIHSTATKAGVDIRMQPAYYDAVKVRVFVGYLVECCAGALDWR